MNGLAEPLSSEQREQIRRRSKVLFGNRDTLEVAAAIARAPDGVVNATHIGANLGLAPNRVRAQLSAFAELGYLVDSPAPSSRRRWFVRRDHRFWAMCLELYEDWRAEATQRA